MLDVRLADRMPRADAVAIPVWPAAEPPRSGPTGSGSTGSGPAPEQVTADGVGAGFGADTLPADVPGFLAGAGATGKAGEVQVLPLPGTAPPVAYLVGV